MKLRFEDLRPDDLVEDEDGVSLVEGVELASRRLKLLHVSGKHATVFGVAEWSTFHVVERNAKYKYDILNAEWAAKAIEKRVTEGKVILPWDI